MAVPLAPPPTGEIVLEFSFDVVVRVEDIVCHWSRDEVAALLAGDEDARAHLIADAAAKATNYSEAEPDHAEITIESRRL